MTEDLRKRIADTIARGRVMLFMKGNPAMPQCGFSAAVVNILKQTGVSFDSQISGSSYQGTVDGGEVTIMYDWCYNGVPDVQLVFDQ